MGDNITRPDHYCEGRKYEPKDVIRDWGLNFNLGSAVKYISRAGRKGDKLEDLQKAKQFLEFEIAAEEKANTSELSKKLFENNVNAVLKGTTYVTDFIEPYRKEIINRIVEMIDKGELCYDDISRDLYCGYQVIRDALGRQTIDCYADEVLKEIRSIGSVPVERRNLVIDRIVERIENDELHCDDIPITLYSAVWKIREALSEKVLAETGKSISGMTCKEAAEIGDALLKGFEEGIKEAEEKANEPSRAEKLFESHVNGVLNGTLCIMHFTVPYQKRIINHIVEMIDKGDLDCVDIPLYLSMDYQEIKDAIERKTSWYTNGILGHWIYYRKIPDGYKARVIDRIVQEVLVSPCDIDLDNLAYELHVVVIDRIVERINNDELILKDIPTGLYEECGKIHEAIIRKYAEDTVYINFEFEVDPEIDTDTINVHVHIKNKED